MSACASAPSAQGVNDPYENFNRGVHAFNKGLDRNAVGPTASVYATIVPKPVRRGISNFAGNVDMPRVVVNDILQGRAEDAIHNTFRFLINSTFGLAGLLDPATDMGLAERETDFGETLHVWGVGEGAYVELPVFGPSTGRDAVGLVVDFALNPLQYGLKADESDALAVATILARLDARERYSEAVEAILYESVDSYAQARLIYLQNRRFELGQEGTFDTFDPYEDPYYDPYADPYAE